jgi:hypothetical protein
MTTPNWVVRAGVAQWQDLITAYRADPNVQGIYGFRYSTLRGYLGRILPKLGVFRIAKYVMLIVATWNNPSHTLATRLF